MVDLALSAQGVYLSSLTKLEFCSALWRKVRTEEITKDECTAVINIFTEDQHKFHWIHQDHQINQSAEELLMRWGENGLRTLDSIQLASAITLREQPATAFRTADKKLAELFKKENLH